MLLGSAYQVARAHRSRLRDRCQQSRACRPYVTTAKGGTANVDFSPHRGPCGLSFSQTPMTLECRFLTNSRPGMEMNAMNSHLQHATNRPPRRRAIERRTSGRQVYPYVQRVISYQGPGPAGKWVEADVRCHDLSRTGFSFWTETVPADEHLVVDLGIGEECWRMLAQVRHATPVNCFERPLYLVGCRILKRA